MTGNKKIFIVGINGFLGSHLAKSLKYNYEIYGLEKSKFFDRIKNENFRVFNSDAVNIEEIIKENEFFAIINASTVYSATFEEMDKLLWTNIILPIKLYILAQKYCVKYFFNTDSFFNDEKNKSYGYLNEYILSKRHLVEWLKILTRDTCLINMKLFHMYGPEDNNNKFVMEIFNQLKSNVDEIKLTEGEQKRDFIYVDDVVEAYKKILDSNIYLKGSFFEFEVGYGEAVKLKDFVNELSKSLNSKSKLIYGAIPYRDNEFMNSLSNNDELKKIGWTPQYNYKDGIKKMIEYYNDRIL
jgi:nucleoside-diphosphate-sugar epimerase